MNIYQYDDFRLFLRDCFEERKQADKSFSYRRFAEMAEIKNPGYLLDVIKAKRALSEKVLVKCAEIFGLKPQEAEFFRVLVDYGQAKRPAEKEVLYKEILNRRNHSNFIRLNPGQTRYYDDTLYPLLIAAIEAKEFRGDYDDLAFFLDPPVPAGRIKKAIRELCEWGFLEQDSTGTYNVVNRFLEPPATMSSLVRKMNQQWLNDAPDALARYDRSERHISTLILSISDQTRQKIMDRLEEFRREIIELVKDDQDSSQVMQLSLAYFPRTRKSK